MWEAFLSDCRRIGFVEWRGSLDRVWTNGRSSCDRCGNRSENEPSNWFLEEVVDGFWENRCGRFEERSSFRPFLLELVSTWFCPKLEISQANCIASLCTSFIIWQNDSTRDYHFRSVHQHDLPIKPVIKVIRSNNKLKTCSIRWTVAKSASHGNKKLSAVRCEAENVCFDLLDRRNRIFLSFLLYLSPSLSRIHNAITNRSKISDNRQILRGLIHSRMSIRSRMSTQTGGGRVIVSRKWHNNWQCAGRDKSTRRDRVIARLTAEMTWKTSLFVLIFH